MNEKTGLDAIDRKILDILQRDGRISNVDLASQVHLSAPQCFRRVRALEERGVLRGYRADVAPRRASSAFLASKPCKAIACFFPQPHPAYGQACSDDLTTSRQNCVEAMTLVKR